MRILRLGHASAPEALRARELDRADLDLVDQPGERRRIGPRARGRRQARRERRGQPLRERIDLFRLEQTTQHDCPR